MVRRLLAAGCTAVLLGLSGCGGTSPVEAVPELSDRLAAVDAAVVAGDHATTRDAVEDLVATAEEAEAAGEIDAAQADAIVAAAEALLARLADEEPAEPEPLPEPTPTQSAAPEESEPEETEESEEEDDEDEHPGKGKGADKHDKGEKPGKPDKDDEDD
ncbi:hypothetical protein ACFP3Q_14690 [Nocardioides sp. GCM10027113]|uniref:hypothetical protein n=1 Tax=unclassified Nocardioides TaxID=2615069 RepID=UPI00360E9443